MGQIHGDESMGSEFRTSGAMARDAYMAQSAYGQTVAGVPCERLVVALQTDL